MKSTTSLVAILTLAGWMLICALISVQNAEPVALEFFGAKSVAIPFGLLLTFTTVLGMLSTIVLQPILFGSRRRAEDKY